MKPAATKLLALLLFLLGTSFAPAPFLVAASALLTAALLAARLPTAHLLLHAAAVLPFSATLALTVWLAGDPTRALILLAKSYLSALATLLFTATTPLPAWTAALRACHVPTALVLILELLYRYLSVLTTEARSMSSAARARGGLRFSAATGAIAVLFARSWHRAEAVHRAMLARGSA